MLKGQGTKESPLIATYVELMDIEYMVDEEKEEDGIVLILRDKKIDELFPLAITVQNFRELFSKGQDIIEALDATI